MRNALRTLSLTVALVSTGLFFGPGYTYRSASDGTARREVTTWSMGWVASPWWQYEQTSINHRLSETKFSLSLSSWSWASLLTAIISCTVWLFCRGDASRRVSSAVSLCQNIEQS